MKSRGWRNCWSRRRKGMRRRLPGGRQIASTCRHCGGIRAMSPSILHAFQHLGKEYQIASSRPLSAARVHFFAARSMEDLSSLHRYTNRELNATVSVTLATTEVEDRGPACFTAMMWTLESDREAFVSDGGQMGRKIRLLPGSRGGIPGISGVRPDRRIEFEGRGVMLNRPPGVVAHVTTSSRPARFPADAIGRRACRRSGLSGISRNLVGEIL